MIHHIHNESKQSIIDLVYNLVNSSHNLVVNGASSYNIKYDYSKHTEFNTLISTILSNVPDYSIYDMWFNIYSKGGYVKSHHHSSPATEKHPWLCGVYNLKKPKNSGDFYLNNVKTITKEDDLLIFKPTDIHYTTPNLSQEDRIVLSFNFRKT